jgi:DnaJ-class molecular chaperone
MPRETPKPDPTRPPTRACDACQGSGTVTDAISGQSRTCQLCSGHGRVPA